MSRNVCCVPGCSTTIKEKVMLHHFPNPDTDPERFKLWLLNIGGDLSTLDHHYVRYNRKVCRQHFKDIHVYPNNRLCKIAVPLLFLPAHQSNSHTDDPSISAIMQPKPQELRRKPEACAVCLSTKGELLDMDDWEQREDFNSVARLNTYEDDGLLSYLCVECSAYVKRFKKFQTKCQRANNCLQEILDKKEGKKINHLDITSINREGLDLLPSLAYWRTGSCHYIEAEFKWAENNEININKHSDVPVFSISIESNFDLTPKNELDSVEYLDNDKEDVDIKPVDNCQSSPNYSEFDVTAIDNKEQSIIIYEVSSADEDGFQDDVVNCDRDTVEAAPTEQAAGAGGSTLDQQYANFYSLSDNQQKVLAEITKGYHVAQQLNTHRRYHRKYDNSFFYCKLCRYYFKTEDLFKSHMSNKHLYKYVCTKCPEVSYDRVSAKVHYITVHLQKEGRKQHTWHEVKRGWITCGRRTEMVIKNKGNKVKVDSMVPFHPKINLEKIFFVRTPLGHLEQYEILKEREKSRNYMESRFKCKSCCKGFIEIAAFYNHLKKHDPRYAGPHMCDVCKLYFRNTKKVRKHILAVHLFRYNCQKCQYVCYSSGTAHSHYRWHENVTYSCPHCDMKFIKQSSQLSHIRIKHPSTHICNICGHSFVNEKGLHCHKQRTHSKEEIELSEQLSQQVSEEGELYCGDCKMHFASREGFQTHLGSSNKHATINLSVTEKRPTLKRKKGKLPRTKRANKVARTGQFTPTDCDKCGKHLTNKLQARQHYLAVHPGTDSLQLCDICGFSSKTYPNLLTHMRTHTQEKPFACKYCDRRFSAANNRDRHHLVHTGEKPYECSHCHRRFAQSSTVKLHIQTVHLKIPYPPWNKKNRKLRPKPELSDSKSPSKAKVYVEMQEKFYDDFISYNKEI